MKAFSTKRADVHFADKPNNKQFHDLTGEVFNRLTVVGYAGKFKLNCWWCECSCGTEDLIRVSISHLRGGHTQFCGCLRRERLGDARRIHGMTYLPENNSYRAARERCMYDKHPAYHNYGGRGIEFRFKDFVEFYECLGDKPEPKELYTLERIDNNGNYEKGNVKWATRKAQSRNVRNNYMIAHNGETNTSMVWSEKTGVPASIIYGRSKLGWCSTCIFTVPYKGGTCLHKGGY